MSGRLQDRPHRFGVEPASRGFETQLLGGGLRCEGRPVGPVLGHGLICIGGSEQAGAGRDHRRRRLAMVAGAVLALMMHAGQGCQGSERRRARQDPLGMVGVEPHLLPLSFGQRAWLCPRYRSEHRSDRDRATGPPGAH